MPGNWDRGVGGGGGGGEGAATKGSQKIDKIQTF